MRRLDAYTPSRRGQMCGPLPLSVHHDLNRPGAAIIGESGLIRLCSFRAKRSWHLQRQIICLASIQRVTWLLLKRRCKFRVAVQTP